MRQGERMRQNKDTQLDGENWRRPEEWEAKECEGVMKLEEYPVRSQEKEKWARRNVAGSSLVVQWLRLYAPNTGGQGLVPGHGTKSHMLQLRV